MDQEEDSSVRKVRAVHMRKQEGLFHYFPQADRYLDTHWKEETQYT